MIGTGHCVAAADAFDHVSIGSGTVIISGFDEIQISFIEDHGATTQFPFDQEPHSIHGIFVQQSLGYDFAIGTGINLTSLYFAFVIVHIQAGVEYTESGAVNAFFVAGDSIVHHHAAHALSIVFDEIQGRCVVAVSILGADPPCTREIFGYYDAHGYLG
jgi:hypothetical protein